MKKILTLVCVSALGGLLTLGGYKLFVEDGKQEQLTVEQVSDLPVYIPTTDINTPSNSINTTAPNFVEAAEKSLDAVVHVKNTAIVSAPMTMQDLFFGRSQQRAQVGTGSGVIISPTGYIVTNNHVIQNANEISITLNNNRSYMAELIGTDETTDIALLKIETDEDLPFMAFGDSDNAKIGEWVLAVGNPFNLNSTVTAGIISAKSRDLSGRNTQSFIQTDAAVNPGNSGGALVNTNGDLIGINTAISSRDGSYIGYSFAVPSNIARKIVNDIMEYGNVQNGILGVVGGALNSKAAKELGTDITEGFYVSEVTEDTGAEKAGIKSGDIIKKIDGVEINKFSDLTGYLKTKSPNDVVDVTLIRDDDEKVLPVTLLKNSVAEIPIIGRVKNLQNEDLTKLKIEYGVEIKKLNKKYGPYLKEYGFEVGNILTKINGKKLYSVDDAQSSIENHNFNEPLRIEFINNNGEKESIMIR